MIEQILREDSTSEFYTTERCFITELFNMEEDPAVSIARVRVEPGVTTAWHRLRGTTERYCILSGSGVVEAGKLPPEKVVAGDVVIIPPDCRQRIHNGGTEDLVFLAICTPRFSQAVYEEIE